MINVCIITLIMGCIESLRSVIFLHLVFLSHSEAHFFSIWSFWVAQKRIFSPFGLSESLRSAFFLHLAFLSRSEAYFFSIWPFWVAQKRIFSSFGLSESLRSVLLLHLVFLSHSEAWKISVWFIFLREIACFLCGVVHDLWFLLFKGFQLLAKIMNLLIKKKQSFAFLMYNLIFW